MLKIFSKPQADNSEEEKKPLIASRTSVSRYSEGARITPDRAEAQLRLVGADPSNATTTISDSSEESNATISISDMPEEILVQFFIYLHNDLSTLAAVFDVCHDWRRIIIDSTLRLIPGPKETEANIQKERKEQFSEGLSMHRLLQKASNAMDLEINLLEEAPSAVMEKLEKYRKMRTTLGIRKGNTVSNTNFFFCGKRMTTRRGVKLFSVYSAATLAYSLLIALIYLYACHTKKARNTTLILGTVVGCCLMSGLYAHWGDDAYAYDPVIEEATRLERGFSTRTRAKEKEEEDYYEPNDCPLRSQA